ncbi:RNA polymerase sigma factor [Candidatus Eisenbacteria bacterium]|uniref:RNA polymerase sigma factor n=1 Tax=Eiseniibacteriota bacterium TaxID=2212470 RepID=A0ABV6YK70_UNCEI
MDNPVSENDRPDIQASLRGDQAAYARLVRRYETQIAAQMWRFTRDPDTLDELVQGVFVEAYLSLRGFRGKAPFLHWLRRIATRVGYHHWKRRAREQKHREALAEWRATLPSVTEESTSSQAAEYLHVLLDRLPPQDRLVLTLHYFDGLDTREIAERTGWNRGLVKVRAYRARRKLKALLEAAGFGGRSDARSAEASG